jgi:hypothetical protein
MIILMLGITTSLFAVNTGDKVLYLNGEITAFTAIKVTVHGVEISSNVLGFNYTLEEQGAFQIITVIAG